MIYVCTLSNDKNIVLEGKEALRTVDDLYKVIAKPDCTGIEIRDDFVEKFYSPRSISKLLNEIKILNPRINIVTENNYWTKDDYNMDFIDMLKDPEDFTLWVLANKEESFDLYKSLVEEHNEVVQDSLVANSKISNLNLDYVELERTLKEEKARSAYLNEMLQLVNSKHNTLVNKINMSYNIGVSMENLEGIDLKVNTYQKILYIKEVTRVIYTDSFIYYLQEILKTLYPKPARLLVIEAPYAYKKSRLYPNCKNHLNMCVGDVFKEDIFTAGYQENVTKDILKNPSRYPYLIILDRSGWDKPFVRGKNVETYYTISDLKDAQGFESFNRILSYNKNTLHVNHIEDFDEMPPQEKMKRYSSMEIMHKTIDLLEGTSNE